jgi:hypothetical protein
VFHHRFLVAGMSIALLLVSADTSNAISNKNLCGNKKNKAIQCQGGKNGTGNGFFNPKMNPKFNPNVDPRYNPKADPRFNPKADPRFNPKADPRFNPGATPCDLGISEPGKSCP